MKNTTKNEVIDTFLSSEDLANEKMIFERQAGSPMWWFLQKPEDTTLTCKMMRMQCRKSGQDPALCKRMVTMVIKRCAISKRLEKFSGDKGSNVFCMPLVQDQTVAGYLGLCYKGSILSDDILNMFCLFATVLFNKIQRESELTRLYETVKPRAIALSTIHTVHRLLSSTLDLDELLPKIARLSLQVMRAKRCTIMLVDDSGSMLIPRASIDYKNKIYRSRPTRIGCCIAGKVASSYKVVMQRDMLCVPLMDEDVLGTIMIKGKEDGRPFTIYDKEILVTMAEQAVIAIKNAQLYKEQQEIVLGSVKSLATLLEAHKSAASNKLPKSISALSRGIGRQMGLNEEELRGLEYATQLHDAGQITVPDTVLGKKEGLTGMELEMIKKHPINGVKIIEPLKALKPAIPTILHHHENYDGSGYPNGLKADQIPVGARIMAVVCAFEAMLSQRPYRAKKTIEEAVNEIRRNSGTQFDPTVVRIFLDILKSREIMALLRSEMGGRRR